jgi:site-specific DNA-methyltransferase (adenine-specific)
MNGDCLELMERIPDESIDLILCDPPYGTLSKSTTDLYGWADKDFSWDTAINPISIFEKANRLQRPNGKCVLFSNEPYTSQLITSAIPSMPFAYRAVWLKNTAGNILGSKKAMVSRYEDICVFSKPYPKHDYEATHPLREYFMKEKEKCGNVDFRKLLENGMASHYFTNGSQFALPTRANYEKLQKTGHFKRNWDELKQIHDEWNAAHARSINEQYPTTFNLWQGNKSKSNVLEYPKDRGGYHPTQKPVALLEDLIRTFSNPGDIVLDFTMGSGSTGVACMNTNRRFIGIEMDPKYFDIAQQRIEQAARERIF